MYKKAAVESKKWKWNIKESTKPTSVRRIEKSNNMSKWLKKEETGKGKKMMMPTFSWERADCVCCVVFMAALKYFPFLCYYFLWMDVKIGSETTTRKPKTQDQAHSSGCWGLTKRASSSATPMLLKTRVFGVFAAAMFKFQTCITY